MRLFYLIQKEYRNHETCELYTNIIVNELSILDDRYYKRYGNIRNDLLKNKAIRHLILKRELKHVTLLQRIKRYLKLRGWL